MRLVVAPRPEVVATLPRLNPLIAGGTELGGTFYDYLRDSAGMIVGVRYYLVERVQFETHPVYRQFLDDTRFRFPARDYIDMVADECNAVALQQGSLTLDAVQDFDGVQVSSDHGGFALVFDLQFT